MECKYSGLGRGVVHDARWRNKTGHTCHAHDVSLVLADHGWEELLGQPEVANNVDLEELLHELVAGLEDGVRLRDSCVVHEDTRLTKFLANGSGSLCDG